MKCELDNFMVDYMTSERFPNPLSAPGAERVQFDAARFERFAAALPSAIA